MPIYKMNGKKDGKQQYRVRINYVDSNGNNKQLTRIAYGSAEAKQLEMQLKQEVKEQPAANRMTVGKLYEEYIATKQHEIRATSLNKIQNVLQLHILPTFQNLELRKLQVQKLQKWKNQVADTDLSITTKKNIYKEFRALLNYAVKMEYIQKNPLLQVGNFKEPYFESVPEKLNYYTSDEFIRFIAEAKKNAETITEWGYYVFFAIAYYTGMRKGEINALKWSDIEGDVIHVRRSIAQKLKGADVETPPKNKSSYRDLQMPLPLIEILQQHKDRQKELDEFTEDFRVCGGIRCLRDTTISNKNIQFAKAAGLHPIRVHDFRHSHASLLANEGINIQEIARRLGHSKIEITWNTYSHLYPREEERALKILNKIV